MPQCNGERVYGGEAGSAFTAAGHNIAPLALVQTEHTRRRRPAQKAKHTHTYTRAVSTGLIIKHEIITLGFELINIHACDQHY
jgi:hypothetical protein